MSVNALLLPTVDRERGPRALFSLMAAQHGVASRSQLRMLGVSRSVEARLVRDGALVRLPNSVVTAGGAPLTFSAQAMAATLRPGVAAVTHGAAARLHRLAGFEHHAQIDVIGTRGSHLRVEPPLVAHYTRRTLDDEVVSVGPIRVTSIPLTLTLVTPEIARDQLIAALADAVGRGVPAATIRDVAERWREAGRSGPPQLLELLDRLSGQR